MEKILEEIREGTRGSSIETARYHANKLLSTESKEEIYWMNAEENLLEALLLCIAFRDELLLPVLQGDADAPLPALADLLSYPELIEDIRDCLCGVFPDQEEAGSHARQRLTVWRNDRNANQIACRLYYIIKNLM